MKIVTGFLIGLFFVGCADYGDPFPIELNGMTTICKSEGDVLIDVSNELQGSDIDRPIELELSIDDKNWVCYSSHKAGDKTVGTTRGAEIYKDFGIDSASCKTLYYKFIYLEDYKPD